MIALAPAQSVTERKISSFRNLPVGWRYGRGGPLTMETVDLGLRLLGTFYQDGLTHTDAFAGESGELMITAYHEDSHYVELMIEADKTIEIIHEGRGRMLLTHRERLGEAEALSTIRNIAKAIWNTSDLFTRVNTIGITNVSPAWLSRSPVTEASLLFNATASPGLEAKFVPMSDGTTSPEFIQNLSSSGDLTTPLSRRPAA
jgi:hypothetical protein